VLSVVYFRKQTLFSNEKMASHQVTMTDVNNCTACTTNTCTEVYHKQVRDEHEKKGFMDKVKDTVEGAFEKVTGKDKDPEYQLKKDIKHTEKRADDLKDEGRKILDSTDKDVKKAEKAQREAAEKAAEANRLAEKALNKQVEGQDKLATAGAKMMEAGAKLQQEAAMGSATAVPYNAHATSQVRQQTTTTGAAVPAQEEVVVRETTTTHVA
jgi:hypothetical protein